MTRIFILLFIFLLTACGGSSGGGTAGTGGGGTPNTVPIGGLAGAGFDGLIINGDVKVYDFSDGKKGTQLAQAVSDSSGLYDLKLQIESRPILIELTNGYYIEEAGAGFQVKLGAGQRLSALVNYTTGSSLKVSTTSLTHVATALAEYEINKGSSVSSAINDANGRISGMVGFDILATTPKMITDAANASASLTPELRYGFMAGGISMWTNDHAPSASTAHKTPYTSIDFAQLLYKDIGADGLLDGKGFDSTNSLITLSFANTPLSVDVYRHQLGVSMLKMANHQNNKTGLNGASVLAFVQSYISSTDSVFANEPPVNIAAPVVNVSSPASNAVLIGNVNVSLTASTAGELSAIELLMDGVRVASAASLTAPSFSFDSTQYSDGQHALGVKVVDTGGLTSVVTKQVLIVNSVPSVVVSAPTPYAVLKGITTVSAQTQSSVGLSEVALLVDGTPVAASPNHVSPSFSVDTAVYADGAHEMSVRATDAGGQVTTTTVPVVIANIAPSVVITSPASTALVRGQLNITATASSNSGLASVDLLIDGNVVAAAQNLLSPSFNVDTTLYSDGPHTLAVRATDVSGKFTTASVTGVIFDNVAPSVTITAPLASAILRGTATITGTASSLAGVSFVELLIDGNLVAKNISSTSFTLNTNLYLDGAHTVALRVTDIGGLATTQSVPVVINNVAPVVTITAPAANAVLQTTISVAATTFSRAGVSAVELLVDGVHAVSASNFSTPTFQLQSNAYADGVHTLGVRATDIGGLITTTSIPVVVSNVPPVLTITSPAANAVIKGAAVAVAATAQTGSGLTTVGLYVDGAFVAWAANPASPSFALNTQTLSDGAHTIGISATDVGGQTTSSTVPVVIDNTAPAVTISAPGNGSWARKTITVSGSVSDVAGLAGSQVLVDGQVKINAQNAYAPTYTLDTTALSEGSHSITISSTDVGGAVTSAVATINVDNTPPTMATCNAFTIPFVSTVAETGSGLASVVYNSDTVTNLAGTITAPNTWTIAGATASAIGAPMSLKLSDAAGNCNTYSATMMIFGVCVFMPTMPAPVIPVACP